ncbi:dTDP-4-dehydrorhamnose reductase [Agromyces sp. LHK192]|uniref:dTDP-4-dehydrorhamnose reductase n=1 Tax=Agromyces sp. LHK192 TaxID=2498704 RepID=UPI000FD8FB55|nr:dTDP-4-dehydrorhamnose reductase [Agromyces sp. LHK192]
MRVLLTGAGGMLGRDLESVLGERLEVTALTRSDLDVADAAAVDAAVTGHDIVVNAAAYTRVDDAEEDEDAAYAVNALGAEHLAVSARHRNARFIHISTDYVFDGTATTPYSEDAPHSPLSAYGRTKAAGERLALAAYPSGTAVVRTAWLYGEHGPNFVRTMVDLADRLDEWNVVDDQVGQPTWSLDLARRIAELIDVDVPAGIYHGTNSGSTNRFDFARAILANASIDPERIHPTDSASLHQAATRPKYSVLGHAAWAKAGLPPMRPWAQALDEFQAGALAR